MSANTFTPAAFPDAPDTDFLEAQIEFVNANALSTEIAFTSTHPEAEEL